MNEMYRREPTPDESARLLDVVRELAWQRARALSDLPDGAPPRSPFDEEALDAAGQRAAVLALLAALREVRDQAEQLIDVTVTIAGTAGAGGQAIGQALKVTRGAVRQKYPEVVSGRRGPRAAVPTTYRSADWVSEPSREGAADRDWIIRARVRLRTDARTGGAGPERVARAGDILEMVMRGRAGTWVDTECWQTDEPALQALFVYDANVNVLEILENVSPWHDRDLGIITVKAPNSEITA